MTSKRTFSEFDDRDNDTNQPNDFKRLKTVASHAFDDENDEDEDEDDQLLGVFADFRCDLRKQISKHYGRIVRLKAGH